MNYPALGRSFPRPPPRYPVVSQPAARSGLGKGVIIAICVVITVIVLLGAIGIALGVGLGVGLNRSSSSSKSSSCSCGCASANVNSTVGRVIGGTTATPNSWPWIVAIYNDGDFTCGGSLIGYRYVLTAAHCVNTATIGSLTVYAGVHKLGDRSSNQMRTVSAFWFHPSYVDDGFDYDVAVIKLSSEFTNSKTVSLACLPSAGTSLPSIGQNGMLIGWGKTSSTASITDESTLQQVILQVQNSSSDCTLGAAVDRQFCAGFGSTASCNGDSGGPINTNVNGAWTATGLVSYGRTDCGSRSVFTRVSFYRSLIDTQMQTL